MLGTRAPDFASALGQGNPDTEVLAASDTVHNALDALGRGHRAWTGHSFLEDPLYREVSFEPGDPDGWARMPEADELARDQEGERFGARLDEVGATVLLHDDAHEVMHLGTATVHSTGVLLSFVHLSLRGAHEDTLAWYRHSHENLGAVELALELLDAATGTGSPGEVHGGEGNVERRCYRLTHRFWLPRALDADMLTGTFTLSGAPTADGGTEPLAVGFELDTAVLRESAAGIRRFGNHAPGS